MNYSLLGSFLLASCAILFAGGFIFMLLGAMNDSIESDRIAEEYCFSKGRELYKNNNWDYWCRADSGLIEHFDVRANQNGVKEILILEIKEARG